MHDCPRDSRQLHVLCEAPMGRGGARLRFLVLILTVLLASGGCGESTSTVEPQRERALPDLLAPDSALVSLELGIINKSRDFYEHAIAETTIVTDADFHATFDPQDTLDYAINTGTRPPQDWTSQNERTFFPYFASLRPVNFTVAFIPDETRPDVPGPNETIVYRHYRIYAGSEPLAVGLADLTLKRVGVNHEWKIVNWVDRRDTVATGVRTYGQRRLDSLSPY